MRLINKNTDYAVRALRHMASGADQVVSVSALAEELEIPHPYLRRILQDLAREGILFSFKGKGGGFRLARPPGEIRVGELMSVFQGPLELTRCTDHDRSCPDAKICQLRMKIRAIEKYIVDEIASASIASLLSHANPGASGGADELPSN